MAEKKDDKAGKDVIEPQPASSDTGTATKTRTKRKSKAKPKPPQPLPPWKVLLHNDDKNEMGFVVGAIVELTPLNEEAAVVRMIEAHKTGVALLLVRMAALRRGMRKAAALVRGIPTVILTVVLLVDRLLLRIRMLAVRMGGRLLLVMRPCPRLRRRTVRPCHRLMSPCTNAAHKPPRIGILAHHIWCLDAEN